MNKLSDRFKAMTPEARAEFTASVAEAIEAGVKRWSAGEGMGVHGVRAVCSECGSADVVWNAAIRWSVEDQLWLVDNMEDTGFCGTCDAEIKETKEVPVSPPVVMTCERCGGTRVTCSASAKWDPGTQWWALADVHEDCDGDCADCEDRVDIIERPILDWNKPTVACGPCDGRGYFPAGTSVNLCQECDGAGRVTNEIAQGHINAVEAQRESVKGEWEHIHDDENGADWRRLDADPSKDICEVCDGTRTHEEGTQ